METYSEYKDSGIPWIGEVPSHWEINKVSRLFSFNTGFTPPTGNDDYYNGGTNIWVNISDLNSKYIKDSSTKVTDLAVKGKTVVPKGSLLYSFKLSVGKMAFAATDFYTNEAIFSIFPADNLNLTYFYYLLDRILIHNANENIYGAKILNQELIKASKLVVPPSDEQTAIAIFLDRKTLEIDTLIEKKKQLIALLKEERTAIINHAVTKGINPDVKYKGSGIDWIGEIPAHWDRLKLKRLVAIKICDGPHETPEWVPEGVPFLSAEAIKGQELDFTSKRGYISKEQHEIYCKKAKVQKGDILFCKSGSTTGKSALVTTDEDFGIWSPLAIIRANNKISNNFLFHYLQSDSFRKQVETNWTFGTQPNIGMGSLENLWIPLPSIETQLEIVEYLDSKTKRIEEIISKTEREIELMQEYKTALISEVVTGKVDVREEVMDMV